jgi:hypothetical protein
MSVVFCHLFFLETEVLCTMDLSWTRTLGALGLAAAALLAWGFLRRRRRRELEYARIQLYEDAQRPDAGIFSATEYDDDLLSTPLRDYGDAQLDSPDGRARTPATAASRPPGSSRPKRWAKAPIDVDPDDVQAVQALIKEELAIV